MLRSIRNGLQISLNLTAPISESGWAGWETSDFDSHIFLAKIFFSHLRAAAQSKLNNYNEAIKDCERAIAIDPKYSKAYGRMG